MQQHPHARRVAVAESREVGQRHTVAPGVALGQHVGKGHFTKGEVVAVSFAVGAHGQQAVPIPVVAVLFLAGGRLVRSAEAGLVALLDVVLGPLWVWLAFGETPSAAALAGGALTFGAVAWYLARQLR